jgi:general secretion pathway protein J
VRGFTLVELLIALAILGMLSVLGYRAVSALTASETQLAAEAERWRALDALFVRLEADCRQALPRDVRNGAGTEPAWLASLDGAGNSALRMSRAGSEFFAEPGMAGRRIGYVLHDDAVEVLYWPALDVPATSAPTRYPLAGGISEFRLRFLDERGGWHDTWPDAGTAALPRAVRATLRLQDGERIERWLALR